MNVLATASTSGTGGVVGAVFMIVGLVIGYWVPTIVALVRHVPNRGSVIVINAFLGWTIVGWVVALAMACRSRPAQPATR